MSETDAAGGFSRLELLKRGGTVGAAAALPLALGATAAEAAPERTLRQTFTASEATTVEAVLERLIPSDGKGAGAKEAKVGRYIDRQLSAALSSLRDFYTANLAALDDYATKKSGGAFHTLTAAQQDAILKDMEANKATGFAPSSSAFFETIREHAIEGMFGDPYHGGNAKFAGWDLLGFPGVQLYVPPGATRLDVKVKPVHKSTADYHIFNMKEGGS
jgi:gluconate 2-dehydrogenase gamma chain